MPGIDIEHMLLVRQQVANNVMCSLSLVAVAAEVQLADKEVAYGPDPFGALVIVMATTLIIVIVVSLVLPVSGVQGLDTHRTLHHKSILDNRKATSSLLWIKKFGSYSHSNAKIWPELIVRESL